MPDGSTGEPRRIGESIGARIATARKLAGLSQRQLAERAHVSYSLLTKVEAGHKPATPVLVATIARALRVEPTHLTGQPYRGFTPSQDRAHACVPEIRRVMMLAPYPDALDAPVRPVEELRRAVERVNAYRVAAKLGRLSEILPGLLGELQVAAHTYTGHDREVVFGLLADTYDATDQVVYKLGYLDLSSIVSDRYEWAARQSGDPMRAYIVKMFTGWQLMITGSYDAGYRVLSGAINEFEPDIGRAAPHELSVYGSLQLRAALVAARRAAAGEGSTAAVDPHLQEASEVADRLRQDRNDYQLVFGPSNVAIYNVATAVEMGDGTTAVARAEGMRLPAYLSRERRAHHLIDLARGWLWQGDRDRSLRCLLNARRVAPQHTRAHPMTHETVRALVAANARSRESLIGLAHWVGVRT